MWRRLEKDNDIPIIVHALQECTNRKGVSISTIYRLQSRTLNGEICHLLMLNRNHVCLIPNMQQYFEAIFHGKHRKGPRCSLCFTKMKDNNHLKEHLFRTNCHSMTAQPPRIEFIKNGVLSYRNLKNHYNPELTVVVDSEAYMRILDELKELDKNPAQEEIMNRNGNTRKNIYKHQAHSIGALFLDRHFNYIRYESLWGDDVGKKILPWLCNLVDIEKQKINGDI